MDDLRFKTQQARQISRGALRARTRKAVSPYLPLPISSSVLPFVLQMAMGKTRIRSSTLKPQPKNGISISKIDAAKRQLHTAIELWFRDGDPVSIHTLVSAAQEILLPIAKAKKTFLGVFDTIYIVPGKEEEYFAWMRIHQNFFKHGSIDPDETIMFNPEADDGLIRTVIQVYAGVAGMVSPLMNAYILRFLFSHPHLHNSDPFPQISPGMKRQFVAVPKADFLALALKIAPPQSNS